MKDVSTVILLCAGRGTRLRPHTDITPKPLLPWQGRPTLSWIVDSLQCAGVSRVVLVTGHLEEQIHEFVASRMDADKSVQLRCVTQEVLDGTAGAISCALAAFPDWFHESFLATATDYLTAEDFYPNLLNFHSSHKADISVSLKLVPTQELGSRSSVAYSGDFDITEVVEKPEAGQAPSSYAANLIYVFPPAMVDLIFAVQASKRGEREIQSAVNTYLHNGGTAKGLLQPVPGEWQPD